MLSFPLVHALVVSGRQTVSLAPTASVFVKSANSLPPVNFHVENSLSEFEWENVFSPGNFDLTNVDDAEDFSAVARGERSTILGQVSPVRKLIVPSEIGSQRKPGEVRRGL